MYKEPESKKVSIIIPNWFEEGMDGKYGKGETLWFARECLDRLLKVTPRDLYELILIDNGSTIGQDFFNVADVLIRNHYNIGFGPACNQGFAIAKGEYIICINNDVLVWPGWIDALLEPFESEIKFNPPVGVVMPALMKETRDAHEAIKMDKIDLTKNHNIFGSKAEFGSCYIIPKTIINKIVEMNKAELGQTTLYDENFLLGMGEDRKLWQQIRILGYETYRTHNTRIFHQGNMSIGKIPNRKKYTFANREYLAKWKKEHNLN